AEGFAEHGGFIRRQVNHAVGHYKVNAVIDNGQVFDLAPAEFDIGHAHARFGSVGLFQHLRGHILADDVAFWPDLPRREEAVDPPAAAQIKHPFARLQTGDTHRVAAAQREIGHFSRQTFDQRRVVQPDLAAAPAVRITTACAFGAGDIAVTFAYYVVNDVVGHGESPYVLTFVDIISDKKR